MQHPEPSQPLFGLRRDHGGTIVKQNGPGQIAFLKSLGQAMTQFASAFGQIPL